MNSLLCQAFLQTLAVCSILGLAAAHSVKVSTISASPAVLPFPQSPTSSPSLSEPPALSPDVTPLFPTPAGSKDTPSPMESSLPVIPSSPSPPNPDDSISSPQPDAALSPAASLPESAAVAATPMPLILLPLLLALCLVL